MPAFSNDTLTRDWSITLVSRDPVARFAAQELRRTLQRIGAPPLPIREMDHANADPSTPRIALECGAAGDGFVRIPDAAGLTLRADGPRGLLYAVYDLLEALGCCWVLPGPAGERLPRYERVRLPRVAVAQQPAFPGRCLIIGHDFFLDDAEAWIIWAARNRLNTIFIHTINQRLALGACRLWRWRARRRELLPLLHERGMLLELGGHSMRDLVPRHLFRQQPELFRDDGRRRTPDYNFCPGNPAARQLLRQHAATFFRTHPEVQIFHLWPDDLLHGGWCHCPHCRELSAADQALLATNELAEVLAQINPHARLAYLSYHDTTAPPAQIIPHPNVVLVYAPRPRSYAHGIADATSAVNVPFWQQLHTNLELFRQRINPAESATDGTCDSTCAGSAHRVFEYYLDGILFKSAPPPLPDVLQADLRAYRDAGVHTVQALMTGDRPWLVPPVNAYLFARLSWDPEQAPHELLQQYAAARSPRAPAALAAAYIALAKAWQPALDFLPEEQAITSASDIARHQLFAHPPRDVLDYMTAPRPLRERRLELLLSANTFLRQGRSAWEIVQHHARADEPHLSSEQAEWELGAHMLQFIMLRQRLYVLAERNPARSALQEALAETRSALDSVVRWGETHFHTSDVRANYGLFRLLPRLHLDIIRDRRLAWPWERLWLRLVTYGRIAWFVWYVSRR